MNYQQPYFGEQITTTDFCLIWVKSGQGFIEVDFRPYSNLENKFIFLSPYQQIKFLGSSFELEVVNFPSHLIQSSKKYRVLFKHLISISYIDLSLSSIPNSIHEILDFSTDQWFSQNPFNALPDEYEVIFDLKELIDQHFKKHWNTHDFIDQLDYSDQQLRFLMKNKIGISINALKQKKILTESQKALVMTDQSIQEIAYDMGFKDSSYFSRFFKVKTSFSPLQFKSLFAQKENDQFIEDLLQSIRLNCHEQRNIDFYAKLFHASPKNLSKKVRQKLNVSIGKIIRKELLEKAKQSLKNNNINVTAYQLNFKEANHFSTFFKNHTGVTPSEFQSKMYHS